MMRRLLVQEPHLLHIRMTWGALNSVKINEMRPRAMKSASQSGSLGFVII